MKINSTKSSHTYTLQTLTNFGYIFLLANILQTFHFIEHIAQVTQKFILGWTEAHGLIGVLDVEWVHFFYNVAYLLMLNAAFFGLGFHKSGSEFSKRRVLYYAFILGLGLQNYHMFEHIVKIIQYLNTGVEGTPGILGSIFLPIWVHFTLAFITWFPIILVFFGYGFHSRFWRVLVIRRSK